MPFSMSQASLPSFEISLNAFSTILDKAAAYAAAKKIDPVSASSHAFVSEHVRSRSSGTGGGR